MTRLFFLVDFIPSMFVSMLEMNQYSIDDMAGNSYRGWGTSDILLFWRRNRALQ